MRRSRCRKCGYLGCICARMAQAQAEVDARTERPVCSGCGKAVNDSEIDSALKCVLDKRPQCWDCLTGALV